MIVKIAVFQQNMQQYGVVPKIMNIQCEDTDIIGVEWWLPTISNGIVIGYDTVILQAGDTPPIDAIKTIRLKDKRTTDSLWMVIDNSHDETLLVTNCNACCGASPDLSTDLAAFPAPVNEITACIDASLNYTFQAPLPINPFSEKILVSFTHDGGQALSPVYPAAGNNDVVATITWLNTNWSAAGTWSAVNSNKTLQLVSTTVQKANIGTSLVALKYCITIPATLLTKQVLTVKDDTLTDTNITIAPIVFTEANREGIATELRKHLIGTITVSNTTGPTVYHIQYEGHMKPVAVKAADLSAAVNFSVGACP